MLLKLVPTRFPEIESVVSLENVEALKSSVLGHPRELPLQNSTGLNWIGSRGNGHDGTSILQIVLEMHSFE